MYNQNQQSVPDLNHSQKSLSILRSTHLTQSIHSTIRILLQKISKSITQHLSSPHTALCLVGLKVVQDMYQFGCINILDIASIIYSLTFHPNPVISTISYQFLQILSKSYRLSVTTSGGSLEQQLGLGLKQLHYLNKSMHRLHAPDLLANTFKYIHIINNVCCQLSGNEQSQVQLQIVQKQKLFLKFQISSTFLSESQLYITNGYIPLNTIESTFIINDEQDDLNSSKMKKFTKTVSTTQTNNPAPNRPHSYHLWPGNNDVVLGRPGANAILLKQMQDYDKKQQISLPTTGTSKKQSKLHLVNQSEQNLSLSMLQCENVVFIGGWYETPHVFNLTPTYLLNTCEDIYLSLISTSPISAVQSMTNTNQKTVEKSDTQEKNNDQTATQNNPLLSPPNIISPNQQLKDTNLPPFSLLQALTGHVHPVNPVIYSYVNLKTLTTPHLLNLNKSQTPTITNIIYSSSTTSMLPSIYQAIPLRGELRNQFLRTFLHSAVDLRPWADAVTNITRYLTSPYTPLSSQGFYSLSQQQNQQNPTMNNQFFTRVKAFQIFHFVLSLSMTVPASVLNIGSLLQNKSQQTNPQLNQQNKLELSYFNTCQQAMQLSISKTPNQQQNQPQPPSLQQIQDFFDQDNKNELDLLKVMSNYHDVQQYTIVRGDFIHNLPQQYSPSVTTNHGSFLNNPQNRNDQTQSQNAPMANSATSLTKIGHNINNNNNCHPTFNPNLHAVDCIQSITYICSLLHSLPAMTKSDAIVISSELKATLVTKTPILLQLVQFVLSAIGFHSFDLSMQLGGVDYSKNNNRVVACGSNNIIAFDSDLNQNLSKLSSLHSNLDNTDMPDDEDSEPNQSKQLQQNQQFQSLQSTTQTVITKIYNHITNSNNVDSAQSSQTTNALSLIEFQQLCSIPQPILYSYLSVISHYSTVLSCLGVFLIVLGFNFKLQEQADGKSDKNTSNASMNDKNSFDNEIDSNDDDQMDESTAMTNAPILTTTNSTKTTINAKNDKTTRSRNINLSFGHIPLLSYYSDSISTNTHFLNFLNKNETIPIPKQIQFELTQLAPIITRLFGLNEHNDNGSNDQFNRDLTNNLTPINNNSSRRSTNNLTPIMNTSISMYSQQDLFSMFKYHYVILSQSPKLFIYDCFHSQINDFNISENNINTNQAAQNQSLITEIDKIWSYYPTWYRPTIYTLYIYISSRLNSFQQQKQPKMNNNDGDNADDDHQQQPILNSPTVILRCLISILSTIYQPSHVETMTCSFRFLDNIVKIAINNDLQHLEQLQSNSGVKNENTSTSFQIKGKKSTKRANMTNAAKTTSSANKNTSKRAKSSTAVPKGTKTNQKNKKVQDDDTSDDYSDTSDDRFSDYSS
jgi:hypothetical protein